jgi:hypothetical protein
LKLKLLRSAPKHAVRTITLLASVAGIAGGTISVIVYLGPKGPRTQTVTHEAAAQPSVQTTPEHISAASTKPKRTRRVVAPHRHVRLTTTSPISSATSAVTAVVEPSPRSESVSVAIPSRSPARAAPKHEKPTRIDTPQNTTPTTTQPSTTTRSETPPPVTNTCSGNVTNASSGSGATAQGGNCSTNVVNSSG